MMVNLSSFKKEFFYSLFPKLSLNSDYEKTFNLILIISLE